MKTPFSTIIPIELLQRLEEHIKKTGESKTYIVSCALADYLAKKEGK